MSSKASTGVNFSSEDDITKRIYSAVDTLADIIRIDSDRYRLSFCISMFVNKEIATIYNAIEQADPRSSVLDYKELEKKLIPALKEKNIL